ncbi:MAG: Tfp pilus assembly protein FimT/FimU [Nitrospiria bacterium]
MRRFQGAAWRDKKGFTLVELTVTIAVIGVMAMLAIPNFIASTLPSIRLKGATRELASDLRYARSLAIANNIIYWVVFEKPAGAFNQTYTIRQLTINGPVVKTVNLSQEYIGTVIGTGTPEVTSRPPEFPTGGPPSAVTFLDDSIQLDQLGRATKGAAPENGEIYLTNSTGEVYSVTLLGSSGRVKIYKWMGASWAS